jgi:hypothetical protein
MVKAALSFGSEKFPRYQVDLSAIFKTLGSLDWQIAHLQNLSQTGLCVQTTADLYPEQILEMVVETTDQSQTKHRRRLVTRVVWRRDNRYGLEFMQLPPSPRLSKT